MQSHKNGATHLNFSTLNIIQKNIFEIYKF
nr:MAG TPA: hypothetical protein [Caudoviricetes sp.]DAZ29515.1 MAG TPA: hypothetical protein [Caudoviricetes sp.]